MTVEFTEYKPLPTKTEPPRDVYITMWSDTLGTYTPESYKGILGRYRYEPRKQEAPTMLYTPDGETVKNRSTGETVGTLTQRKIGNFYHWHFQGVEVDGKAPEAAPLQIMWAIRGEAGEALEFARERYNNETRDHRLALYGGSYSMRKLAKIWEEYAESKALELNYCGDLHALLKKHVPVIDMYTKNIKGLDAAPIVDAAILKALNEIEKHSEQYREDVYHAMTLAPTIQ